MNDLGPAPASPLQLLRPGDRDPRQHQRYAAPPKNSAVAPPRDPETESVADFEKGDDLHQLDERA